MGFLQRNSSTGILLLSHCVGNKLKRISSAKRPRRFHLYDETEAMRLVSRMPSRGHGLGVTSDDTTDSESRQISRLYRPTGRVLGVGTALDKTRDRPVMSRSRIFLSDLDDVARMDELLAGCWALPFHSLGYRILLLCIHLVQRALPWMVKLEIDFETVDWTVGLMLHRVSFPFLPIAFERCLLVFSFR